MLYTRNSSRVELQQPHWLFTFGDMMAIIACVFIVIASMSEVRSERFEAAAASLHDAFGGDGSPGHAATKEQLDSIEDRLSQVVSDAAADASRIGNAQDFLSARALQDGVVITVGGPGAFGPSTAAMNAQCEPYVKRIAEILSSNHGRIEIRGHAFAESESGIDSTSDLRALSFARASLFASILENSGVDAGRIIVAAHGAADPMVAIPQSANARAMNRRVEIRVQDRFDETAGGNPAGD